MRAREREKGRRRARYTLGMRGRLREKQKKKYIRESYSGEKTVSRFLFLHGDKNGLSTGIKGHSSCLYRFFFDKKQLRIKSSSREKCML